MSRLLAISPHLDDAVFSAGGTLAQRARQGWRVIVATCFTGNVARPAGFALACQLDKGLGPDVDYMALRRAEDIAACAAIGAEPLHLPFLEAPHRGYASAAALFGDVHAGEAVIEPLIATLRELVATEQPDVVFGPLAVGGHVDHRIVRTAVEALGLRQLMLWEDWPYVDRASAPVDGCTGSDLDERDRAAKIAGALAYRSQVEFQFGSAAAMSHRLLAQRAERLHAVQPRR